MAAFPSASDITSQSVFVKIFSDLEPDEREECFGRPLNAFLEKEGVGQVTGGGTMQSGEDEDGYMVAEFAGLDVSLTDFERGFNLLRTELLKLGVPKGTVLEYTRHGFDYSESVHGEFGS